MFNLSSDGSKQFVLTILLVLGKEQFKVLAQSSSQRWEERYFNFEQGNKFQIALEVTVQTFW